MYAYIQVRARGADAGLLVLALCIAFMRVYTFKYIQKNIYSVHFFFYTSSR